MAGEAPSAEDRQEEKLGESSMPSIGSTSHIITVPSEQSRAPPLHFAVTVLHLSSSLSVSVSAAPDPAQIPQLLQPEQENSGDSTELSARISDLHLEDQSHAAFPLPVLSKEWAVAMNPAQAGHEATTTSLFRTVADVSRPMAARLARRLNVTQLFLSLDLPPSLSPNAQQQSNPSSGKTMLLLERGITDAVRQGVEEWRGRRADGTT